MKRILVQHKPLWFPARDGDSGLIQIAPRKLIRVESAQSGWTIRKFAYPEPVTVACLDSATGNIVTTTGFDLLVNGKTVGRLASDQAGGCEVQRRYAWISTYAESTGSGPTTAIELWRLGWKPERLWTREFDSFAVPAFVGHRGTVAVASEGTLREIAHDGSDTTTAHVLDVKPAPSGAVAILRSSLQVEWRS